MFEESTSTIPSIWASMNSWFTPAVLFVLLNVMIGTIAFTSTLANQKQHHRRHPYQQQQQHTQNDPQQPNLARSPSVLQRLRSINFYSYRSQEPQDLASQFKPTPDSDVHYNLQHGHQIQPQNFEAHSQYIFAQEHQEKQTIFFENPQGTQPRYFPQSIYQEKPQENQSQYFFEQTNEEKPQENQSQYFFEQTNEEKHQENGTHFAFEQVHEENAHEIDSHSDFQQAHEGKGPENQYHFDSEQAHEENFENDKLRSLDEVYSQLAERHVSRSKSDTKPVAGEIPARLPAKMKKSASTKSAFKHFDEEDIVEARRPATVKERKTRVTEADEEVDAKADDFINRFKQQLKLQRLDSIIRYKEMIGRGGGR